MHNWASLKLQWCLEDFGSRAAQDPSIVTITVKTQTHDA